MAAAAAVGALLLVLVAPSPRASVLEPSESSEAVPLVLDLTGYVDETVPLAHGASLPENADGIGPGSQLIIDFFKKGDLVARAGCTANFVWADGKKRYLGAAGHCFILPEDDALPTDDGPASRTDFSDVEVRVCVTSCVIGGVTGLLTGHVFTGSTTELGPVVYARQSKDGEAVGNDFGLVEIPADLGEHIREEMPVFGGPTKQGVMTPGRLVCHYGAGVGVGETFATMGRSGIGVGTDGGAWFAAAAANVGDSGSAIQLCEGTAEGLHGTEAVGIVTHLVVGTDGVVAGTTVERAIEMAQEANLSISLVLPGTTDSGPGPQPEPSDVTVSSVEPSTIPAGATTKVKVSGSGFAEGATVQLSGGKGPTPEAVVTGVSPDGTELAANITVKKQGPKGSSTWDVTVTNQDGGSGTLHGGLTVER